MITAVIPSKDKDAIEFCVKNLKENSTSVDEIIVLWNGKDKPDFPVLDVHGMDVYAMFNLGAKVASSEYVLFANDDMYFPPKWDAFLEDFYVDDGQAPMTFTVVEPGIVDVSHKNILKDFGRTLETFKKEEFDKYADEPVSTSNELGWYMPVIFHKSTFNEFGYYPTEMPFPHPNDIIYFEMLSANGIGFYKASQKIYHFQRLSQRPKMPLTTFTKLNLCCGNDKREGYLNADISNSDFDFDLSKGYIPFQNETFEEIIFKHALEHFRFQTGIEILKEIHRVLLPTGKLHILVPDLAKACEDFVLGYDLPNCAPAILRIYGQNTNEEFVHKWGYSPDDLTNVLLSVGFTRVDKQTAVHADEIYIIAEK